LFACQINTHLPDKLNGENNGKDQEKSIYVGCRRPEGKRVKVKEGERTAKREKGEGRRGMKRREKDCLSVAERWRVKWRTGEGQKVGQQQEKNTLTPIVNEIVHVSLT